MYSQDFASMEPQAPFASRSQPSVTFPPPPPPIPPAYGIDQFNTDRYIVVAGWLLFTGSLYSLYVRKRMQRLRVQRAETVELVEMRDAQQLELVATVDRLPTRIATEADADGEAECAVCLCAYEVGEELRSLPLCKHYFHKECIDSWLVTDPLTEAQLMAGLQQRLPACPLCKTLIIGHEQSPATRTDEEAGTSADGAAPEGGEASGGVPAEASAPPSPPPVSELPAGSGSSTDEPAPACDLADIEQGWQAAPACEEPADAAPGSASAARPFAMLTWPSGLSSN